MKLSPYTIAKNCSDITDVNDGIYEIEDFMKYYERKNKKIPSYFYTRYYNLHVKKYELSNK